MPLVAECHFRISRFGNNTVLFCDIWYWCNRYLTEGLLFCDIYIFWLSGAGFPGRAPLLQPFLPAAPARKRQGKEFHWLHRPASL